MRNTDLDRDLLQSWWTKALAKAGLDCDEGALGLFERYVVTQEAGIRLMTGVHAKRLCGKAKHSWQVFCGGACSSLWEAGQRAKNLEEP